MTQASYEVRPVRNESISILVQRQREANAKKLWFTHKIRNRKVIRNTIKRKEWLTFLLLNKAVKV